MNAIVVARHGDVSVLQLRAVPDPAPGPGEVGIRVKAAGVNFADVLARLGIYKAAPPPPFVPGIEVAGIVEAPGSPTPGFHPGDRVMAFCRFGGYAERVAVPESFAMAVPAKMTFEEAAGFPVQYLTAYHGLFQLARVSKRNTVLIHAAAGGVGTACLQLLQTVGSRVFATVGDEAKVQVVRSTSPAARVVVYTEEDFAAVIRRETDGRGVDVVMDSVGGDVFRKSWDLLAPAGRHVLFGAAAAVRPGAIARLGAAWRLRKMLAVSPLTMIEKNRTLAAFNLYHLAERADLMQDATGALFRLYQEGAIRPRIGLVLPLDQAAEAHRLLQSRRTTGKVILTVA
jgi:synaptic vesicle membrane protein VAT-1